MKTIEQFKDEYLQKIYLNESLCKMDILEQNLNAIDATIEFAQRWIPVEEENPPKDEAINEFGFNASITVEVRNEFKIQSAYFKFDTGQWRSLITGNIINPTHFRLIELK